MYDVQILDHEKLRAARGSRTLEEIALASGGEFSIQQLSGYEKGKYQPRPERIPILLKALNVSFPQVAKTITYEQALAAA